MLNLKIQISKRNHFLFLFFSLFILSFLCSCKNFYSGSEFINNLEKSVNYSNADYVSVEIKAILEQTQEITPFIGKYEKNYKKGDSISVNFIPTSKYVFSGWKATPEDAVLFENQNANATTITIVSDTNPIVIEPVLSLLGFLTVNFSADYGMTIPSESKTYYKDQSFDISYRDIPDYLFTGWKVLDAVTQTPVNDVLNIENPMSLNTNCTVLKTDCSIILKAEAQAYPKVFTMTPTYVDSGSPCDSKIRILFTQNISKKSIYFSKNELDELQIPEQNRLLSNYKNDDKTDFYYGYIESGKTVFKNIQINERNSTNSLNSYFDEPYLDPTDASVLLISPKRDLDKANHPLKLKEIEVILGKNICNENDISLQSPYSSCYLTNDTFVDDAIGPEFIDWEISLKFYDLNGESEYKSYKEEDQKRSYSTGKYFRGDKKLTFKFEGTINDQSNIRNIGIILKPAVDLYKTINIDKIYKKEYKHLENVSAKNGNPKLCFGDEYAGQTDANEALEIEFDEKYENIIAGPYYIYLYAEDKFNNSTEIKTPYTFINNTIRELTKEDIQIKKSNSNDIYSRFLGTQFWLKDYLNAKNPETINDFSYCNCDFTIFLIDNSTPGGYYLLNETINADELYTISEDDAELIEFYMEEHNPESLDLCFKIHPKETLWSTSNTLADDTDFKIKDVFTFFKKPIISFEEYETVPGKGCAIHIKIIAGEYEIYKICTEGLINIVEVYMNKKQITGTSNNNEFTFNSIVINPHDQATLSLFVRGFDATKPSGKIWVEDEKGNKSNEINLSNYHL